MIVNEDAFTDNNLRKAGYEARTRSTTARSTATSSSGCR